MAEQENEYGVRPAADSDAVAIEDNLPTGEQKLRYVDEATRPQIETVSAEAHADLKAERDQLLDRMARLQAEFDNARKRQEREKQEFRDYATGNVVEQFLPVIDNFALALNANASAETA